MEVWQQVKLLYIGMLVDHRQPELAETFFNSVTTKILHRSYFQNDFIFVRPAISTEYIEPEDPRAHTTYRCYYPSSAAELPAVLMRMIEDFGLRVPFEDLRRDVGYVTEALLPLFDHRRLRANFQIQVLHSLFYRNKGAYAVGKLINGFQELPFALPILHNERGQLVIDALLHGEDDLLLVFSFARAYFMVDMEVPSAYVQFLRSIMPRVPSCTTRWAWPSRARPSFTVIFSTTCGTAPTSSASPPVSRGWSCWCLTCRAFHSCSRSSRIIFRRRRTPRASRSGPNTSWSSSTTASGAWPIRSSSRALAFRSSASVPS
jgi:hypothetical protein